MCKNHGCICEIDFVVLDQQSEGKFTVAMRTFSEMKDLHHCFSYRTIGPETYKGLPSAFDVSNRTRGLHVAWLVTRVMNPEDDRAHLMSRDEVILEIALVDIYLMLLG
jgi:hypothetical protein